MRVRAADPERGDGRAARAVDGRPVAGLGEQLDRAGGPVHLRGGLVDVQGPREPGVPQRENGLDDAADTGRRLGVTEVRLQRPEPQRLK